MVASIPVYIGLLPMYFLLFSQHFPDVFSCDTMTSYGKQLSCFTYRVLSNWLLYSMLPSSIHLLLSRQIKIYCFHPQSLVFQCTHVTSATASPVANRRESFFCISLVMFLLMKLLPYFADLLHLLSTTVPISDSAVLIPTYFWFYICICCI